jgi:hypothetical protein
VIGLSLFPGVAYRSVLRWLICGLQWLDNHRGVQNPAKTGGFSPAIIKTS